MNAKRTGSRHIQPSTWATEWEKNRIMIRLRMERWQREWDKIKQERYEDKTRRFQRIESR